MTVNEFLTALEPNIKVSITETQGEGLLATDVELLRMYSGEGATSQLSAEILARVIDGIYVLGKTSLKLHLSTGTDDV